MEVEIPLPQQQQQQQEKLLSPHADTQLLVTVALQDATNNRMAYSNRTGFSNQFAADFVGRHFDCRATGTGGDYDYRRIQSFLALPTECGLQALLKRMRVSGGSGDLQSYTIAHPFGVPHASQCRLAHLQIRASCLAVLSYMEEATRYAPLLSVGFEAQFRRSFSPIYDNAALMLRRVQQTDDGRDPDDVFVERVVAQFDQAMTSLASDMKLVIDTRRQQQQGDVEPGILSVYNKLTAHMAFLQEPVYRASMSVHWSPDHRGGDTQRLLPDVIRNVESPVQSLLERVEARFVPLVARFCNLLRALPQQQPVIPAVYIQTLLKSGLFDEFHLMMREESSVSSDGDESHPPRLFLSTIQFLDDDSGRDEKTLLVSLLARLLDLYLNVDSVRVQHMDGSVSWRFGVTHPFCTSLRVRGESRMPPSADRVIWTRVHDTEFIFYNNLHALLIYYGVRPLLSAASHDASAVSVMARKKQKLDDRTVSPAELTGLCQRVLLQQHVQTPPLRVDYAFIRDGGGGEPSTGFLPPTTTTTDKAQQRRKRARKSRPVITGVSPEAPVLEPTVEELRTAQYTLQTAPTYATEETPPGLCMLRPGVVVYQFAWHRSGWAYLQYFGGNSNPVRGTEYRRFSTSLHRAADTIGLERPPREPQAEQNGTMKFPLVEDTDRATLTSLLVGSPQQHGPLLLDLDAVVANPLAAEDFAVLYDVIMVWCDTHKQTRPTLNTMDEVCGKILYWLYQRIDSIDGATSDDRISLLVSLALNLHVFERDSRTLTLFLSAFHRPALVGWIFMSRQCALDLKYDTHTEASRFAREAYQARNVFDVAGVTHESDDVYTAVSTYKEAEFLREQTGPMSRYYRIMLVDKRLQARFDTEWAESIDCGNGEIATTGTMGVEPGEPQSSPQEMMDVQQQQQQRTEKSTVTEERRQRRVERRRYVGGDMVVDEITADAHSIETRISCINRNLARTELSITQAMADDAMHWTPDEAERLRILSFLCDLGDRGDGYNCLLNIWRQYSFRVLWLVMQDHMNDAVVRVTQAWYSIDAPNVKLREDVLWIRTHMSEHYGVNVQFELGLYEEDRIFIQFMRGLLDGNQYYKRPSEHRRFQALTIGTLYRIYTEYFAAFYRDSGDDNADNPYIATVSVDTLYQFLDRLNETEGVFSTTTTAASSSTTTVKPRTDDERMDVEETTSTATPPQSSLRVSQQQQQKQRPVLRIEKPRYTLRITKPRIFPPETAIRLPRVVFDMHSNKSHTVSVRDLKATYKSGFFLGGGSFGIVALYRLISSADESRKLVGMGTPAVTVRECVVKYQQLKDRPYEREAMLYLQNAFVQADGGGTASHHHHHHIRLHDYAKCELDISVDLITPTGVLSDALGLNRRSLERYLREPHGKALVHGRKPIDIIVQQYINGQTLHDFLYENINTTDPVLDMGLFLNCVIQLTGYMGALYRTLLFTHNDIKFDNVLVERVTAGSPRVWAYETSGSRQLCIDNLGILLRVGDLGTARFKYKNPWFDVELILLSYLRVLLERHSTADSDTTTHYPITLASTSAAAHLVANPRFLDFLLSQMRRYAQVERDFKNDSVMETEEGEHVEGTVSSGKIAHHFIEHVLMVLRDAVDTGIDMKRVCQNVWTQEWLSWINEHVRSATMSGGLFTVRTTDRIMLYGNTEQKPGLDLLLLQTLDVAYAQNNDWRRNIQPEHDGAYERLFAYITEHWPGMVYDIVGASESARSTQPSYQIMNRYRALSRENRFNL